MKIQIKLFFYLLPFVLFVFSCKKDNPKHLVAAKWVAETPVKYTYSSGGNNIGVGSSEVQWEILEMDFTSGEEGAKATGTAYYGSGSFMTGNEYPNGIPTPFSFDWGHWKYFDYSDSKENKFKNYDAQYNIPEEWKAEKRVVGELFNNSGSTRFHVFSISKKTMKVAFEHINSFYSGTNNRYYSPIMTFKRK